MPPWTNIPLSPSELSYLRTSLSHDPPLRPDGRATATQFRPLVAETDILPNANGSARICFADGSEAIVGVKAEVEKLQSSSSSSGGAAATSIAASEGGDEGAVRRAGAAAACVDVSVEIPGFRDDDALPVFLAEMLVEAIVAAGGWEGRARINERFRWRVYVDILLLSQPLSYPLPLLSLTTHLALRSARLPALESKGDEDPLFNDDWEASVPLYGDGGKPPVTLLVMSVGDNILFDPSRDELAVSDAVVAISIMEGGDEGNEGKELRVVAVRTIDPPSRLTASGTLDAGGGTMMEALAARESDAGQSSWRPPRGGLKRQILSRMIKQVIEKGGVGNEVIDGLIGVEG